MKFHVHLRTLIVLAIVFSSFENSKVFGEATHPTTLAEMSAAEISCLDAATLLGRYGDELKSDKQFTQEQKDAVRAVLMTNMAAYQKESKNNEKLYRSLLLVGAGLAGWFIRRWYRNNFT